MAFVKSIKTLLPNQEIEITVKTLTGDGDEITEQDWVRMLSGNPAFAFLQDEAENIYSLTDGTPLADEK